jgi:hypothetical protein
LGVVVHTCHPTYIGNIKGRIMIQAFPGINERLYLKNNQRLGTGGSAYNPSYSGGRDQEDHSLKPAWAK